MRVLVALISAVTLVASALSGVGTSAQATPGADDYPTYLRVATQDSITDPWLFLNRECTSFVAWRLNNDNHVGFSNYMRGPNGKAGHFGDASNWAANAAAIGFPVNTKPAVGAVAWWASGHVAWVQAVNTNSTVLIEEYNFDYHGTYRSRTISSASPTRYIHIADLSAGGIDPIGAFDSASGLAHRAVRVRGWTLDDDQKTSPVAVHAYIDGPAGSGARGVNLGSAQQSRPDVGSAYLGSGNNHGIDALITDVSPGVHTVYLYAINIGSGSNALLGTKSVTVPQTAAGSPIGQVDKVYGMPGRAVRVQGWTLDTDAATRATRVHVYLDGPAGSGSRGVDVGLADLNRPDVGAAYPGSGNAHGLDAVIDSVGPGWHTAWVYGINRAGGGENPLLGMREFYVPSGDPIGTLDSIEAVPSGVVRLRGWSDDPDSPTVPTAVHVYLDGPAGTGSLAASTLADMSRPDVTRVYPTASGPHGFDLVVDGIAPGEHTFYVYAINAGGSGGNPLLGARTITMPSTQAGSPFGNLDTLQGGDGALTVRGWAIDNDTPTSPIRIHVYVGAPAGSDGATGYDLGPADRLRADVGAAFPGTGDRHGFEFTIHDVQPGQRPVYVYAINAAGGTNVAIGGGVARVSIDRTPPTVRLTSPKDLTTHRHFIPLSWRSADSGSGTDGTSIRWRSRRAKTTRWGDWNTGLAYKWLPGMSATSPHLRAGHTYCFQARSRDAAGNRSRWTRSGCAHVVS